MNFLIVVLIIGVFAIIGIFVLSHYRSESDYKRVFSGRVPKRFRKSSDGSGDTSAYVPITLIAGGTDSGSHGHSSHGSVDCGSGHSGGDGGGGCSDGGGGGGH